MEEIVSTVPGLPRSTPTVSYWQDPPADIAHRRTTDTLPSDADVVIVGSGISGACTANNFLTAKASSKVVILEARQAASGASGRNGGHTKHASYRSFPDNLKTVGEQDAIKIAQLEYDCMMGVQKFIEENGIDCDLRRVDTVDIFHDQQQYGNAVTGVNMMKKSFGTESKVADYTFYNPEEAATQFLTPNSYGALRYAAGSLSAYKLTIGILKLAIAKGLNLQTNTPATKIEKTTSKQGTTTWLVHTNRGIIQTPTLILATNGYTPTLYEPLQGNIIPFRGIVTAQRPGQNMPQKGLPTTYSFIYANGYDYMITRPQSTHHEGDIIIGGGLTKASGKNGQHEFGNTDDTTIEPSIAKYLHQCTHDFFGFQNWGADHDQGRTRTTWSGIMGYSADGYPFVGPVPGEEGLYLDASFQGHGMVLCFLCADAVTKMVLGEDGTELDEWFPKCFRVTNERMTKKFNIDSLH